MLGTLQIFKIRVQQTFCYLLFPLLYLLCVGWMKYIQKYSIKDHKNIRSHFRKLCQKHPKGLLICPNHLTYLDSMLLIWAFGSPWHYIKNFRQLCWNLPKAAHVNEHILYRVVCYLGKCLPINPQSQAAKTTMNQASHLLKAGHYVMVFPEGTRSQTGKINQDNYVYGVGQLHLDSGKKELLSVYLRGDQQSKASKLPSKGSQFSVSIKLSQISSDLKGRRAMRDVAYQMIQELVELEADYDQSVSSKAA